MVIEIAISVIASIIALFSVIILYKTIQSNKELHQNTIFNEVVKQERELRITLQEYREELDKKTSKLSKKELMLSYDTILFNYYEFLAILLYKKLIREDEVKLYFRELLKDVKVLFDVSVLFKEGYARKEEYKGVQWLFKIWGI